MPSTPIDVKPLLNSKHNAAYLNTDNYISTVKNHGQAAPPNPVESTNKLGRNAGLAMDQLGFGIQAHEQALRSDGVAVLTTDAVNIVDSNVSILGRTVQF